MIRNTPPPPLAPAPFNVPARQTATLNNGLRIVLVDEPRLPIISLRLAFFSGDSLDPEDQSGVCSAMAALMTEGTETYTSREIAERVERLGAGLSATAGEDFTFVSASTLSAYFDDVVALVSEIVTVPTFPSAELDLYRRNTIENLKYQRSQPGFLASEQMARNLYGEHPYSRIAPTPEDISKLTREDLKRLHQRRIVPNNAVMIVVGDVRLDNLVVMLEERLGGWPGGELPALDFDEPSIPTSRMLTVVDRPGSAQANIVIGNLALRRDHPDHTAASVMNQILGAGASSRVFMNLREEKGYTYGAYTRLDAKRLLGEFEATAEVRTAVTGDTLKEFFYELERIRTEKVGKAELEDAKNFLTGVFPIRAETQEGLTNLIVTQQIYGLRADHLETYRERISAITADDVLDAAQKYVRPESASIVIVGDGKSVVEQASSFAENVEVYDTEKTPLDAASLAGKGA